MASFSNTRCSTSIEDLLFSVAILINYLSWIWETCCRFGISTCCFTFSFMSQRQLLSLSLMSQLLLASDFSFTASSTSLSLHRIEESGPCYWLGFGLRNCCGCFDLLYRPLRLSPSVITLFYFFIIHLSTRVALFISFKNLSFAFTPWPTVWHKGHSFQPVSAFDMLSSLSLTISCFWLKVREVFHLNT